MKKLVLFLQIIFIVLFPITCLSQFKLVDDEQLNELILNYNINPRIDHIFDEIIAISDSELINKTGSRNPLIAFFSCIFDMYPELYDNKWKQIIRTASPQTQYLLKYAKENPPGTLIAKMPTSPTKNDMNWACYFTTGEIVYLNNIIDMLPYTEERNDRNLFFTGGTAQASIAAIVRTNPNVKKDLESIVNYSNDEVKTLVHESLNHPPSYFNNMMKSVLKKQMEKGVWN